MTRDLIPWLLLFAGVMAFQRWLFRRAERRETQPRTLADTLAEQNQPSNVIPLRAGPNRKRASNQ